MIEILDSPLHVGAYRFTGQLTGDDYDACIADLETRLARFPRIAVVSDLSDMHGVSLDAFGKDLRYATSKLGEFGRFARGDRHRQAVAGDRDGTRSAPDAEYGGAHVRAG